MEMCWKQKPEERPTFSELLELLLEQKDEGNNAPSSKPDDIYMISGAIDYSTTNLNASNADYSNSKP